MCVISTKQKYESGAKRKSVEIEKKDIRLSLVQQTIWADWAEKSN